jgi:MFS transporter, DHA1 family, inner membrane transport protein
MPSSPRTASTGSLWPFFLAASAWNFALGMSYILVPLYAYELGYSALAIGGILSLPVFAHVVIALVGGAYTDRLGGRQMALGAFVCFAVAGAVFAVLQSFAALLVGQLFLVISRATFWPAIWAIGSQLPGDRGTQMGRLNATTNGAQIVGTAAAGVLVALIGFKAGFWVLAAASVGAFASMFRFQPPVAPHAQAAQGLFATYATLLRRRTPYYGIACAMFAALPLSLSMSFYPILLVEQGNSSDAAGWMLALRALGGALIGAAAGRFVRSARGWGLPFAASAWIAFCVLAVALLPHPVPVSMLLFGVGVGSGLMTLVFQMIVTETSAPAERGAALALSGVGWQLSHAVVPIVMGALADRLGVATAFPILGAAAAVLALGFVPLHRWAMGRAHAV